MTPGVEMKSSMTRLKMRGYLQGDAGDDTLTARKIYGQDNAWRDDSGELLFTLTKGSGTTQDLLVTRYASATDRTVLGRVMVKNYQDGQLGLSLGGAAVKPSTVLADARVSMYLTAGSEGPTYRNIYDQDGNIVSVKELSSDDATVTGNRCSCKRYQFSSCSRMYFLGYRHKWSEKLVAEVTHQGGATSCVA